MRKNPKEHIISYLKERNIYHKQDTCEGAPRITMSFDGYPNSPSKRIESCIYLYKNAGTIEARVYFAEPGPQVVKENVERLPALYRLLNYINACVFVKNMDGIGNEFYSPSYLLQPRFYLTEDDCYDITATMVLEEDCFWVAPLEIEDFITAALPTVMDQLSPYIYGVLIGSVGVDTAITCIRQNILGGECNA